MRPAQRMANEVTPANGLHVRRGASLALHGAAAAALVPAYLLIAPASHWDDPALLLVLWTLAIITDRHEVPLPSGVGFDALLALMLLAVALAGPLPALGVIVVPWAANVVTRREPPLRAGALANLAGYGWQAISAALVLRFAGVDDATSWTALPALLAAGVVIYTVGWAVGPAIYGTLWVGSPLQALARSFVDMSAAGAVMIVLGSFAVLLTGPLGLAALALFAVIAVLPQSALTYAARTRPVARLDRATATRRYARALAVHLGLARADRRHLDAVAAAARRRPPTGQAIDYIHATLRSRDPANVNAQLVTEWWNGRGGPIGLHGAAIPLPARILAVAAAWSDVTAAGTAQLGHHDALEEIAATAGTRFDPAVVAAARQIVAEERVSVAVPAPEPRLHLLHIPGRLRRSLATTP